MYTFLTNSGNFHHIGTIGQAFQHLYVMEYFDLDYSFRYVISYIVYKMYFLETTRNNSS